MFQNKRLLGTLVALFFACQALIAQNDSTLVYFYTINNGKDGLMMAEESSSTKWKNKGLEQRITSSDFGEWGNGKRMYNPQMYRDEINGRWYLVFSPTADGSVLAVTSSPDLIKWTVQEYRHPEEAMAMIPPTAIAGKFVEDKIKDKNAHGTVFKVSKDLVNKIKNYQRYRKSLETRNEERASQDVWRFAGIDTIAMEIMPDYNKPKNISDKFIGIFFEDINYAADGGLYAELIQNRDFEYNPADRKGDSKWNATKAWHLSDSTNMKASIKTDNPIHSNNKHYIQVESNGAKGAVINEGYDGIAVKEGSEYNVSLWIRAPRKTAIKVLLTDENEVNIGNCKLTANKTGEWQKLSGKIKAKKSCSNAALAVVLPHGTVDLDLISLMPVNTYNNRPNGLRADIASVLADLKPRFIRFPGGCVSHGDGIDNIYDWKGSIGSLEERIGKRNLWGYHQTRGLGFYEYFQMCEDFGAEPLPVLAAGVPCQNSATHSHVTCDTLTAKGQQGGIPMEEMGDYIQDILDLIEYANGDVTTTWGAKRADAGHPEPFNLKMIGIGNEDLITDVFKERFLMIFNAIKSKYPKIEVVGTVGPYYEGSDYEAGWAFARENNVPIVDEHYYVAPGWFIHNGNFYDNYDRNGTKVYLGEYASHTPDRASSLEAALSNALYLTNVERNADVVTMTSYAPLLAKKKHTQWKPDLIYFNNTDIMLTPDYYVQKMYGNNAGSTYIPSKRQLSVNNADIDVRLGQSIVIDEKTGDTIIRLVNLTPAHVKTSLGGKTGEATITVLSGNPDDTDSKETVSTSEIDGTYTQPPYSFTVLRFKNK